jgi:hypothetical protein
MLLLLLSPVTVHFSPVLLLNQRGSPSLKLRVSNCSTSRSKCHVLVQLSFVVNIVDVFLVWLSKFFKPFITTPVAPIITGKLLLLLLLFYFCCCLLSQAFFLLVLLLNQRRSPPLSLQVSHCSTFCIM